MKKPKGKFRCIVCGLECKGSALCQHPTSTAIRWTCSDVCCGGNVEKIGMLKIEDDDKKKK